MQVIIVRTAEDVAAKAADIIVSQLARKPESVLGLATGSTPVATYGCLIDRCKRGEVSFSACHTVNLDEYLGLPSTHRQSYRSFMNEKLFSHIDIRPECTHIPDGQAPDPEAECQRYESTIAALGGVDLQLLGIGRNGHIGFNEPTSSLASRTRVKTLTPDTVAANARFFAADEFQPRLAITMGIGTIMEADEILLLATGNAKSEAVANMIEGPVSAACPASALQFHPRVSVVLDEEAASGLALRDFYHYTEQQAQRLAADRLPD